MPERHATYFYNLIQNYELNMKKSFINELIKHKNITQQNLSDIVFKGNITQSTISRKLNVENSDFFSPDEQNIIFLFFGIKENIFILDYFKSIYNSLKDENGQLIIDLFNFFAEGGQTNQANNYEQVLKENKQKLESLQNKEKETFLKVFNYSENEQQKILKILVGKWNIYISSSFNSEKFSFIWANKIEIKENLTVVSLDSFNLIGFDKSHNLIDEQTDPENLKKLAYGKELNGSIEFDEKSRYIRIYPNQEEIFLINKEALVDHYKIYFPLYIGSVNNSALTYHITRSVLSKERLKYNELSKLVDELPNETIFTGETEKLLIELNKTGKINEFLNKQKDKK